MDDLEEELASSLDSTAVERDTSSSPSEGDDLGEDSGGQLRSSGTQPVALAVDSGAGATLGSSP